MLNNLPFTVWHDKKINKFQFPFFWITWSIDPACAVFTWGTQETDLPWCKRMALSRGWRWSNFIWALTKLPAHACIIFFKKVRDAEGIAYMTDRILKRHHEMPLVVHNYLSLSFYVPFILFIQLQFSSHWSESQYMMPPFSTSPSI